MKRFHLFHLGFLIVIACSLGCTRLPHRDPEIHFSYFPNHAPAPNGQAAIKSLYLELAASQPYDHQLMLLDVGDDALLARLHLIRAATESIDIQTFIWKGDNVTRVIYQELLDAARRGVKVRVLIDALNPISGNTRLAQMAVAHPNLEIALFRPLSTYTQPGTINKFESMIMKMRRLNRRMHNKLILIDGQVGIIGGRNYENKYFDRNPVMIFKDRDLLVIGPNTIHMEEMFEKFWYHKDSVYLTQFKDVQARLPQNIDASFSFIQENDTATMKEVLIKANAYNPGAFRPQMHIYAVEEAAFFWDPPGKFSRGNDNYDDHYGDILNKVLETANKQIIFQSPYLIYQSKTKKAVHNMRERHPHIQIIFSSNSLAAADHDIVYGVSFKDRKRLYKNLGLEIFEFKPYPQDLLEFVPKYPQLYGLSKWQVQQELKKDFPERLFTQGPKLTIHAKTFTVDEKFTQIGSHNFDPRSAALNTECGLFIEDHAFTQLVRSHLLTDISHDNSWIVGKRNADENIISNMSGYIGSASNALPVFDIWPYTYTSNFELKPGQYPLPSSRHPEFYQRYRDVGQFPMTEKAIERIRAKFMKGFGGWTSPFM